MKHSARWKGGQSSQRCKTSRSLWNHAGIHAGIRMLEGLCGMGEESELKAEESVPIAWR